MKGEAGNMSGSLFNLVVLVEISSTRESHLGSSCLVRKRKRRLDEYGSVDKRRVA